MKKTLAMMLALLLVVCLCAGCGEEEEAAEEPVKTEDTAPEEPAGADAAPPAAADVSWEAYQEWLVVTFADTSPDPEGVAELIRSLTSWEDIDTSEQPWEKIFGEEYFDASTWDEYVAAGGVGTYNTDYSDDTSGGEAPSGEKGDDMPSGEKPDDMPSGEKPDDMPSGES